MEMVRCLKIAVFVGFFVGCLEVANAQSLEIQKLQFASMQHLAMHSGNVIEIASDIPPKSMESYAELGIDNFLVTNIF